MEETAINEMVRDMVISQLNELTLDMKTLVTDVKDKIDTHMQKFPTGALTGTATLQPSHGPRTYAEALVNPPSHANPRLAAREAIRARQFMLEGLDRESKAGQMGSTQLKAELNRIIGKLGLKGNGIRSALPQKHRGILMEVDDDDAASWMKLDENRAALCSALGPSVMFKARVHNVIAFNVALTIDPDNQKHREEICKANYLNEDAIVAMRWVKPIQRQAPSQKTAHLILSLTDINAANRAIANGLTICNRRTRIEKIKKEPIRCLKCHGWNHYANECVSLTDVCGNCAERHRTSQCTQPQVTRCVSCNTDSHASWDIGCPTFLKKIEECNRRNPENALQFPPTESHRNNPQLQLQRDRLGHLLQGADHQPRSLPRGHRHSRTAHNNLRRPHPRPPEDDQELCEA